MRGPCLADVSEVLGGWSDWVALQGAGRNPRLPAAPGLYRIRREGGAGIDYIGQTGGSLRGRLGMLSGVYRPEMPYRDPHFAAPCLWALRHLEGCEFEASVVALDAPVVVRKGLEAVAVSLYRRQTGSSPIANFGRMPSGYKSSSANNARLAVAGKRFRGGPDSATPVPPPHVPVNGDLHGDPQSRDWVGWSWSEWLPAHEGVASHAGVGLYRLGADGPGLAYVGQGAIRARVKAHLAKTGVPGHPQAAYFSESLEVSWMELPGVPTVHLLEHENDLIAAHVLSAGRPPLAQFLG